MPGVTKQSPLGYSQCDWEADGQRCRYPGSMSTNLGCTGPWYCRLHYGERNPIFAAQIVQASMDYQHPTADDMTAEARNRSREYCEAIGMTRRAGEGSEAYMQRVRAWFKSNLGQMRKAA